MELSWYELFGAHFRKLAKDDIDVWDEIMDRKFNNLSKGEILSAVETLVELKRKGEMKYADIDNLISAIIKGRWEAKKARGDVSDKKCDACCGGLLMRDDGKNVPCLCDAGHKLLAKMYPNEIEHDEIRSVAKSVIGRQHEIIINNDQKILNRLEEYNQRNECE